MKTVAAALHQKSTVVVMGASGGIGKALLCQLQGQSHVLANSMQRKIHSNVVGWSRPDVDYNDESSMARAALSLHTMPPLRLLIVATGYLSSPNSNNPTEMSPERSLKHLNFEYLTKVLHANVIGPALFLKHMAPILPKHGDCLVVFLSAKIGSIADNHLGGWYGYRTSKAALNQLVKTASIELRRHNPKLLCLAMHPGTVATPLSAPFVKIGLNVRSPEVAAEEILHTINAIKMVNCDDEHVDVDLDDSSESNERLIGIASITSGDFCDYNGQIIPW